MSKADFCSVATRALATETLLCFHAWSARLPREEFLEFFLVKVDDHVFDGNGFRILTVALRHHLLVAKEDFIPQRSRHLVFHRKLIVKNLQKKN